MSAQLPVQFAGQLTGRLSAKSVDGASIDIQAQPLTFSGIQLRDPRFGDQLWQIAKVNVEGSVGWLDGKLRGSPFRITSDFGSTELRGVIAIDRLAGPLQEQLTSFAGELDAQVDIVRLNSALPGFLPMRDDAKLMIGAARFHARAANDEQGLPKIELRADTDQITGSTCGKQVSIAPMSLDLVMRPTNGWPTAEKLELRSVFANASASGAMAKGNARFDLNLEKLAEFLRPLIDVPELKLGGQANGNVEWALQDGRRWQLTGNANAARLDFQLPGGASLSEPAIEATVDAAGVWDRDHLNELSSANLTLNDGGQRWNIRLADSVGTPTLETTFPLIAEGRGQLTSLRQLIGPWLPAEVAELLRRRQQ